MGRLYAGQSAQDRAGSLDESTPLFGNIPELDSLGVIELAVALESHFDITIDDEDFTSDIFETVGSLGAFVDQRREHTA